MKNWKIWILIDENGNILSKGRKRDVTNMFYMRWCYEHIFTDRVIQTSAPLVSESQRRYTITRR